MNHIVPGRDTAFYLGEMQSKKREAIALVNRTVLLTFRSRTLGRGRQWAAMLGIMEEAQQQAAESDRRRHKEYENCSLLTRGKLPF